MIDEKTKDIMDLYDIKQDMIKIMLNKDLFYKTYYYEIAYIEGNNLTIEGNALAIKNEKINFKNTLIESAPFIVTGALVK